MKISKLGVVTGFLLSICLTSANTIAQIKENKYIINGTIKNMAVMPAKLYLSTRSANGHSLDSAEVKEGKYQFTGNVDRVRLGTIRSFSPAGFFAGTADQLLFLIDSGNMNIVSDGSLKNSVFSGAAAEAANGYAQLFRPISLAGDTLQRIMKSEEFKTNPQLQQALQIKVSALIGQSMDNVVNYVKKHPQSHAATFFIIEQLSSDQISPASTVDSLFNLLPADQQASIKEEYVTNMEKKKLKDELSHINREANKKMVVGKAAEDFIQNDTNGKPVSLSSFKGKYVFVDFWASWCAPCRAENPNVVKAFNTYGAKGFTVLGVSLDSPNAKDAWLAAIEKDGLKWTQVSDLKGFDNAVARQYGITSIPQNFLVDPNGVIVAVNLRAEALEQKLAEIFK